MTRIKTDQFRYDSLENVKGQKTRHMFDNMGYSRESIVQFIDLSTQNPNRLERREKLSHAFPYTLEFFQFMLYRLHHGGE